MGTSSAIPEHLLRHGGQTQELAELLARAHAALDGAHRALLTTRPSPAILPGPLPDVAGELSRLVALTFETAELTRRVGAAFLHADNAPAGGPVLASDHAIAAFARSVPAAAAAGALLDDLRRAGPASRRAIVECLPDSIIGELLDADPAFLGNTDGIPEEVRYRANLGRAVADLRRALLFADFPAIRRLAALLHPPGGGPAQILLYDPVHGHVAQVFGDLATAAHVAVVVPGCGTTIGNFSSAVVSRAESLFHAAATVTSEGIAVVAWLGYNPPALVGGWTHDEAKAGAAGLASLLATLGRRPDSTLVLVAHSYGSVLAGRAMTFGPPVDDVVALGSPGMDVDPAIGLNLRPGGALYAEALPGDAVAQLEAFGAAPHSRTAGGVRLTTNAPGYTHIGGGIDGHAHSEYFVAGSKALANMALVVAGRGSDAERQQPSPGDRVADAERELDPLLHPEAPLLDEAARHYDGPGHEVVELVDRASNVQRGLQHTAARVAVDEAQKACKKVPVLNDVVPGCKN